jgi:hypothetical protein
MARTGAATEEGARAAVGRRDISRAVLPQHTQENKLPKTAY